MPIVFPDLDKLVIQYLDTALASLETSQAEDVTVTAKKTPSDISPRPSKEVVVVCQYGPTYDDVRRVGSAVIDVWCDDFATATELALLVAAVITQIPGDSIKRAVVALGPTRLSEEGPQERRSMTVDFIVKGIEL